MFPAGFKISFFLFFVSLGSGLYQRHFGSSWNVIAILKTETFNKTCRHKFILIADYYDWIKHNIESEETSGTINLQCEFKNDAKSNDYVCCVQNLTAVEDENFEVTSVSGKHRKKWTDKKIKIVEVHDAEINFLPDGIGLHFENLQEFSIARTSIKFLSRKIFKGMKNLNVLWIVESPVEDIFADAFADLTKLKYFLITQTKVKSFHVNLLATMTELKNFYAGENEIENIDTHMFRNNPLVETINLINNRIISIRGSFESLKSLTTLDLTGNKCSNQRYKSFIEKIQNCNVVEVE